MARISTHPMHALLSLGMAVGLAAAATTTTTVTSSTTTSTEDDPGSECCQLSSLAHPPCMDGVGAFLCADAYEGHIVRNASCDLRTGRCIEHRVVLRDRPRHGIRRRPRDRERDHGDLRSREAARADALRA
jgi:hypothetical protein